jgi:hypothetical protein
MSARKHVVHLAVDGRARCGNREARLFGDGDEVTCALCLRARKPVVHLERDGRARCGNRAASQLTDDPEAVTCGMCANLLDGTHHLGVHWADPEPCGSPAAYRRHLRREGAPVRCQACLAAERRRRDDWRRAA